MRLVLSWHERKVARAMAQLGLDDVTLDGWRFLRRPSDGTLRWFRVWGRVDNPFERRPA